MHEKCPTVNLTSNHIPFFYICYVDISGGINYVVLTTIVYDTCTEDTM